jgi:small conductance mechanosensitive channel
MTAARLALAAQDTTAAPTLQNLLDPDVLVPELISTAVILLIAIVAYRVVKLLIKRMVERQFDDEDPVGRRLRLQRAHTLASLLGSVAFVVIATITGLTVLDNFLDIGPLLASVGVLGLAVSFGAQSLVKDVITGTFMLLESQFGVGDIVRISDVSGQVERITLRTTTLRDLHGVVHIVPNGEITRVSNLTKAWSRAVLDIGVAYRENVDHVIQVLKDVGSDFRRDSDWGARLLEEPQVMGVESLADSAVVIRLAVRTLPQQQFDVARELRRRIKNRFDAEGIEIPFPHVTMYWGQGQQPGLSQAPAQDAAVHPG